MRQALLWSCLRHPGPAEATRAALGKLPLGSILPALNSNQTQDPLSSFCRDTAPKHPEEQRGCPGPVHPAPGSRGRPQGSHRSLPGQGVGRCLLRGGRAARPPPLPAPAGGAGLPTAPLCFLAPQQQPRGCCRARAPEQGQESSRTRQLQGCSRAPGSCLPLTSSLAPEHSWQRSICSRSTRRLLLDRVGLAGSGGLWGKAHRCLPLRTWYWCSSTGRWPPRHPHQAAASFWSPEQWGALDMDLSEPQRWPMSRNPP